MSATSFDVAYYKATSKYMSNENIANAIAATHTRSATAKAEANAEANSDSDILDKGIAERLYIHNEYAIAFYTALLAERAKSVDAPL